MDSAKRKTLKTSSLEKIDGIGPNKAKKLLAHFKTITALKEASLEEIKAVKGVRESDAKAIYEYFR
jgi:excinuclease ABC subunit C